MPVEEDAKPREDADRSEDRTDEPSRADAPSEGELAPVTNASRADGDDAGGDDAAPTMGAIAPSQMGTIRFVYAGYFVGAVAVGFMFSKLADFAWVRVQ